MNTGIELKHIVAVCVLSIINVGLVDAPVLNSDINKRIINDVTCLAKVVYDEARGESFEGKIAVANVVNNRAQKWNKKICEVVFQVRRGACQFSGMCKKHLKYDDTSMDLAYKFVVKSKYVDNTEGATFFHANYVSPKWKKHYERTRIIGRHHFYRSDQVLN